MGGGEGMNNYYEGVCVCSFYSFFYSLSAFSYLCLVSHLVLSGALFSYPSLNLMVAMVEGGMYLYQRRVKVHINLFKNIMEMHKTNKYISLSVSCGTESTMLLSNT